MSIELISQQTTLTNLQSKWSRYLAAWIFLLVAGYYVLDRVWEPVYALRWLILSGLVTAYQLWLLRRSLVFNHRIGEKALLPALGLGNSFTLTRGLLFAGLTGFLLSPRPPGDLAWIPAGLYTAGVVIDFLDGYAARMTNHVTKLGEILDMSMDGWGMLVASILAVQYGQVPAWYILVGLARYLFLFGLWIWNKMGWKTCDLPANGARRPFAGLQMGFAFIMLWPIFTPPGTHTAAVIFSIPFLINFLLDWLVVSGLIQPFSGKFWDVIKRFFLQWLPLFFRLGVIFLTVRQLITAGLDSPSFLLDLLVGMCILVGSAGRISAVAGMVLLGMHQIQAYLTTVQLGLMWRYGVLMYLGTGAWSVWKPEDRLIFRKAGEKSP